MQRDGNRTIMPGSVNFMRRRYNRHITAWARRRQSGSDKCRKLLMEFRSHYSKPYDSCVGGIYRRKPLQWILYIDKPVQVVGV